MLRPYETSVRFAGDSEQAEYSPRLQVQIDVVEHRPCGQARHRPHRPEQRIKEAGAHRGPDIADRNAVPLGDALLLRVMAQAQVRFGHVHGQLVETEAGGELYLSLWPPALS